MKSELDLSDNRYEAVRNELIEDGVVEKYRCRGGGIRLTREGIKEGPSDASDFESSVSRENDLYRPFAETLRAEAEENEERVIVCDTSSLRMRGRWSNPDVTRVAVRSYPLLRRHSVVVTTYEVKQWQRWNTSSVFEAASHNRFAHESYVALEWAKNAEIADALEELRAVCGRFGVGLITLHKYYSGYRYVVQHDPDYRIPRDDLLEEFLGYVFERQPSVREEFDKLMDEDM